MIVVTGATGFLGRNLLKLYADTERFVCLTRRNPKEIGFPRHPHVTWQKTDYREDLTDILKEAEGVIHFAGRKADAEKEGIFAYRDNYELTEHLFAQCRNAGVANVVYLSSRCVYSDKNNLPFSEKETPRPLNLYGLSKRMGELMAGYYHDRYGMNIKSLRLSQVFGVDTENAPSLFLKCAKRNEPITLYGKGKSVRDYLYVKNAAHAIMQAVKQPSLSGVYNVGSGEAVSYLKLAETASMVYQRKDLIRFLLDRKDDPVNVQLDCKKAERELGVISYYSLSEAFEDMKRIMDSR